jgi:hypothetical protein
MGRCPEKKISRLDPVDFVSIHTGSEVVMERYEAAGSFIAASVGLYI